MHDTNNHYLMHLGARVLTGANNLKRTPEALANEVGWDETAVRDVIAGETDFDTARALVHAMVDTYPIALDELWVTPDDTDDGVRVMSEEATTTSSRVFNRKDCTGGHSPYYDYRDTAMSRTGPFKPEWIQPLRVVEDAGPDNCDVAYNKGHLLHQTTFFIGEVNFYWTQEGKNYGAEMNTGDSNYITPFVPHSFTSRDPEHLGLIIAITYAGGVSRALDDFGHLGSEQSNALVGDLRQPDEAFSALLARHLQNESLRPSELARRLLVGGLAEARASALADGSACVHSDELNILAEALHVRPSDLMVSALTREEEVVLHYRADTAPRPYPSVEQPAYLLTDLARTKHQPGLKGFDVTVVDEDTSGAEWLHSLHEYIYNYGDTAVTLHWGEGRTGVIAPGGSAYIRPGVMHRLSRASDEGEGRVVVVRVPGDLTDSVLTEFAAFAADGRSRVGRESTSWF